MKPSLLRVGLAGVLVAAIVAACGQPVVPTPATSETPAPAGTAQPTAQPTPAISEAPTAAPVALRVRARITEQCGSEGGCAYYADLDGPGGPWHAKFVSSPLLGEIIADEGMPGTLPLGAYTLTLTSYVVSDVIVNNQPPQESLDTTCSADFTVAVGQLPIFALGTFQAEDCSVDVSGPEAVTTGRLLA